MAPHERPRAPLLSVSASPGAIELTPAADAPAPLAIAREPPKPICATAEAAEAWAAEWWREYEGKVKAHDPDLYFAPERLYALLEAHDGSSLVPVKLMSLRWILKRAAKLRRAKTDEERRALALPRRQWLEEHEPEAFLPLDELA